MRYLDQSDIIKIGNNWGDLISVIEDTVIAEKKGDFAQPIKPYLRFNDLTNRIIAMPAFVGGKTDMAGIKWIASFPNNIYSNIPRANSVTVLNNSKTGEVESIINTVEVSKIRTSAVSGLLLDKYLKSFNGKAKVLIIGFGPIGQTHYNMLRNHFSDKLEKVEIFDLRKIEYSNLDAKDCFIEDWQSAFGQADVVITTTVAKERYINLMPKENCLLLNVSLRDYKTEMFEYVKENIIVDNWEEINRENTDIENYYLNSGLQEQDVVTIYDALQDGYFKQGRYFFNPMGMAIFDIAIATYFYNKAKKENVGKEL
ncbi:MAG: 2,3-diaminopropionate biosynthesis protein SbnB [Clostridiales bacterium]|nr:2,3-diaminopropionate biosynthesis protein SbnB [Clostridiales bacterium]